MPLTRSSAIEQTIQRKSLQTDIPREKVSNYFGENVFNNATMMQYVPKNAFNQIKKTTLEGSKIDRSTAEIIALAMKAWALEKGATSYTHWFQPLTGGTAEKHEAFFTTTENGRGIESFSGEALVQQEPDASSFPHGGIRQTFEARGYTAWDPSSPAFIMKIREGKTLCIPTIFISYTGESLDYKAPLLKSIHLLETATMPIINLFDRHATHISATLGWEQEYFLVDEAMFAARLDLSLSGRTMVGRSPAKGQQMGDHYFGSIPERVYAFMLDLEKEAHLLGIPVRTKHNELAPSQFECAPIFEELNVAVDHNQLLLDLMERIAKRHKLRVLLHEKPFAGLNGSGKHSNWSIITDTGKNLLSPGKTPRTNLLFLTTFINVIKAVANHSDLVRASIASAGNDLRLGIDEAPPAIMSVYVGSHLMSVLQEIEKRVKEGKFDELYNADLKLDIHNKIPYILLDNTDHNRTSPFAFTGDKFELRSVGSSANCALPMTIINTIVANQFIEFKKEVDKLKREGESKYGAIMRVLRRYIKSSKHILFEGDNYSEEWLKEAKKRKLANIDNTPDALDFFLTKDARDIFSKNGIYTEKELQARYGVLNHRYTQQIQIDARVLDEISLNYILPAALAYQTALVGNVQGLQAMGFNKKQIAPQLDIISRINKHTSIIKEQVYAMIDARKEANKIEDASEKAKAYCKTVKPYFDKIRYSIDKLELIVDNEKWPLPKYRELLFLK